MIFASADAGIDAGTNIDIVIVNITIIGRFDKFWRLLWHLIIFA